MSDTKTGSSTADTDVMRSFNLFVYGYFALLIISLYALAQPIGLFLAGAVVLGGHLLLHAPLFVLRGELKARCNKPAEAVREELSSVRNPLTSMWLANADVESGPQSGTVHFTRTGPLGLFSKRYQLSVTTLPDETIEQTIQRDGRSIVTARSSIESTEAETAIEMSFERNAIHAFSLLLMTVLESRLNRSLAAHGYDFVQESYSIGLRFR
ncbi:hypothetical protein [Natrinema salaciae]|uniref:Uncharacterized protein n=1 Tax=Natrinema salaciae TaxID=1186196 RepID=A0A1H9KD49_9EURY|nr:hypothetical protein [Natrinema salaciae]SEQ96867.1 hypothetical protein SAMN04489841_2881 [Natrinema salaciae]